VDTRRLGPLVALHQAMAALRGGECTVALAGGVTVMSTPGLFQEFSRQRGRRPGRRPRRFADAADGAGFSRRRNARCGAPVQRARRRAPVLAPCPRLGGPPTRLNGCPAARALDRRSTTSMPTPSENPAPSGGVGERLGAPVRGEAALAAEL